jgi:hypothetical protein
MTDNSESIISKMESLGINLDRISPEEKNAVIAILNEMDSSDNGSSGTLQKLVEEDFEEIPVDIDKFIEDDEYIGKITGHGSTVYPFWRDILRRIFDPKNNFTECLTGDTMIPLLNGETKPIKDIVNDTNKGSKNYVYSYDLQTNKFTPGLIVDGRVLGYRDIYKVTLDNGNSFRATGTHRVLTRDKHYVEVKNLRVGDSLMPLNRSYDKKGYEIIEHPQKDGTFIEEKTHKMSARFKGIRKGVIHHKDFNKRNNYPENLCKTTWRNHRWYHALKGNMHLQEWRDSIDKDKYKEILRGRARRGSLLRWSDPAQHEEASERMHNMDKDGLSKRASDSFWNSAAGDMRRSYLREKTIIYNKENNPNLLSISRSDLIRAISNSININNAAKSLGISRTGLYSMISKYGIDTDKYIKKCSIAFPNRYWSSRFSIFNSIYVKYGRIDDSIVHELKEKGKYKTLPYPSKISEKYFPSYREFVKTVSDFNHKILSVEYAGKELVYDLQIDKFHNFALDCGIVSSNCIFSGAIGQCKPRLI